MLLEFDKYYHIYNRANGWEKIFLNSNNYQFFLEKYELHLGDFVDTYCYCLMPNHFHLLIKVKEEEEVLKAYERLRGLKRNQPLQPFPKLVHNQNLIQPQTLEKVVSKQFSNLFSSYTQAFNKVHGRMGSLFMKNFKRKPVTDELYFKKLVHYIHHNPIEAKLCDTIEDWDFSSYKYILQPTARTNFIARNSLLEWFNDENEFKEFHKLNRQLNAQEE